MSHFFYLPSAGVCPGSCSSCSSSSGFCCLRNSPSTSLGAIFLMYAWISVVFIPNSGSDAHMSSAQCALSGCWAGGEELPSVVSSVCLLIRPTYYASGVSATPAGCRHQYISLYSKYKTYQQRLPSYQ